MLPYPSYSPDLAFGDHTGYSQNWKGITSKKLFEWVGYDETKVYFEAKEDKFFNNGKVRETLELSHCLQISWQMVEATFEIKIICSS